MPVPAARFSHVHVDLVGPIAPSREGCTYLLTVIDRSTRWPEAVPLRNITAEVVLDVFVGTWVARFGVPTIITSDRGAQFTSAKWRDWCTRHDVQHNTTTALHPQSNGMVERMHRQLTDGLRAREAGVCWADHLPWVLLGMRATPKDESGISAGEAALGHVLAVPGQLPPLTTPTQSSVPPPQPQVIPATKRTYAEAAATPLLDEATHVYVRQGPVGTPLAGAYAGPFEVVAHGPKTFKILHGSKVAVVSRDRLKPHAGEEPPTVAQPPKRGRPPRGDVPSSSVSVAKN